jgi:hypothetical protein
LWFVTSIYRRGFKNIVIIVGIMTPVEIANMLLGIVISVGTIISITALGIRWLVKHYFDEIKKELKPNSGTSIKDQVTRLEDQHLKLETKIDDLYDKIIDYLSNKNK